MTPHDGRANREALAGSRSRRFGGEEHVEYSPLVLSGDADAVVADLDDRPISAEPRADGDDSLSELGFLDRLRGIDQLVDENLGQFVRHSAHCAAPRLSRGWSLSPFLI